MRLSRTQIIAGLTLLLTLAIAFLTGIVNSYIPLPWIQSHIWLVLVLLALFIILELFFTIKGVASNNSISQIKEDQFNDFLKTVSDAESEAQADPDFEHTPFIAGKLLEWQSIDARLISILNIQYNLDEYTVGTWQRRANNEALARLVLRLTHAIMPALTHSSSQESLKELFQLAAPTYVIAAGLGEWTDATRTAYTLALSFYEARESFRAKHWMAQMEKSLRRITSHEISDGLYSRFFDMKGIIARDFDGEKTTARKHLNDALVYAHRAKNPLAIKRITAHLATLEKKERNFAKAIELYKQALAITSPPNDLGATLECYEALGEIALNEENDADSAYNWYLQQLHLAERTIRPPHQVSAHRGLARTLLIKNTPDDIKQAYRHAREALGFEDKESNKNELYIFLVHIADLLLYQH
ncbi:MAG TPA: hypothetical protein VFQ36_03190 [Ktedonobacteraceae bacterium]|nr:hypothetical protein [Ktedonobacteraceae bacterium]